MVALSRSRRPGKHPVKLCRGTPLDIAPVRPVQSFEQSSTEDLYGSPHLPAPPVLVGLHSGLLAESSEYDALRPVVTLVVQTISFTTYDPIISPIATGGTPKFLATW